MTADQIQVTDSTNIYSQEQYIHTNIHVYNMYIPRVYMALLWRQISEQRRRLEKTYKWVSGLMSRFQGRRYTTHLFRSMWKNMLNIKIRLTIAKVSVTRLQFSYLNMVLAFSWTVGIWTSRNLSLQSTCSGNKRPKFHQYNRRIFLTFVSFEYGSVSCEWSICLSSLCLTKWLRVLKI